MFCSITLSIPTVTLLILAVLVTFIACGTILVEQNGNPKLKWLSVDTTLPFAIRYGYYDYLLGNTLKADLELFFERLNSQLLLDLKLNVKNHILIKEHKSNTKLPYNNIVYIEAYGSYSNLYTENRFYTISKTIKSIIHNFPETFVRVHRSYAVNLDHVQSFSAEEVIMNNETRIKISRTRKMALSEAIQRTA